MKASPEVEAAVLSIIKDSWDAYRLRDVEQVLSFYSSDPDLVAVGTGLDERFVGREALKAGLINDFSLGNEATLRITWASVSEAGNVAWVAADCVADVIVGCQTASVAGRLTAVLEKRSEKWYIMQTHFSLPTGSTKQSCSSTW
jgi:ketosteroid isomerase-like protein